MAVSLYDADSCVLGNEWRTFYNFHSNVKLHSEDSGFDVLSAEAAFVIYAFAYNLILSSTTYFTLS
jgi:hypothetical protein